jgi:1,4-dihydroxy-2-naphthoyl-CoA hydrolase
MTILQPNPHGSPYRRTLRLGDTDAAGVVYFASLLSICHEAYEDFLEQKSYSLQIFLQNSDLILPITHAEIDFLAPLQCGDRLTIHLQFLRLDPARFDLQYAVHRDGTEEEKPAARALTRHIALCPTTRQKVTLPDWFSQLWIEQFPITRNEGEISC